MKTKVLFVSLIVLLVSAFGAIVVDAQGPSGRRSPQGGGGGFSYAFTYQGRLENNGAPVNNTCDFKFGLWDSDNLGSQIGSTVTVPSLLVTNGLFTAPIDFGANAFKGDARYLGIAVACPAGGSYTPFSARQALTPAPMALALPGLYTQQNGTSTNVIGGYSGNHTTAGVYGATIGGGGTTSGGANVVTDNYGTVSGGAANLAGDGVGTTDDKSYATVGGGSFNTASGWFATVSGGNGNTASGFQAMVGGGFGNTASGNNSTIPGGQSNSATGQFSFAAGRQAVANHEGAFVWADSSGTPITSTASNQFVIRASNGVLLTKNAGSAKDIAVGERYRDNAIIAWGDIASNGSTNGSFGIFSVVKTTGTYTITLSAMPSSIYTVVPIAIAEVDSPPTSAASARLVTINIIGADQFVVYSTNGDYTLVDQQFLFMVTGR